MDKKEIAKYYAIVNPPPPLMKIEKQCCGDKPNDKVFWVDYYTLSCKIKPNCCDEHGFEFTSTKHYENIEKVLSNRIPNKKFRKPTKARTMFDEYQLAIMKHHFLNVNQFPKTEEIYILCFKTGLNEKVLRVSIAMREENLMTIIEK